jgi:hypothetical protein
MFLAIIFLVLGFFLLLNAFGIVTGHFWILFWAVVLLAIGIRLLTKKRGCPMCEGMYWSGKLHDHVHGHHCECEDEHDHGAGESKHDEKN